MARADAQPRCKSKTSDESRAFVGAFEYCPGCCNGPRYRHVISVEIRDVAIPPGLQDAMSRRAQAEREKEARIILGTSEKEIAQTFVDAAEIYAKSPGSMQLRAMNLIYEATKERGMTIVIPSAMADSMNPAVLGGLLATAGSSGR